MKLDLVRLVNDGRWRLLDRLLLLALASIGGSALTGQVGVSGSFVFDAACSLGGCPGWAWLWILPLVQP